MFTTTVDMPLWLLILWSIPACGALLWLFIEFLLQILSNYGGK